MINKIIIITGPSKSYKEIEYKDTLIFYDCQIGKFNINIQNTKSVSISSKDILLRFTKKSGDFLYKIKEDSSLYNFNNKLEIQFIYENKSCINDIFKVPLYKNHLSGFLFSRLFSVLLKIYFKNFLDFLLINFPDYAIAYIRDKPFGLKQNTVIKENLAYIFINFNLYQNMIYESFFIFASLLDLDMIFIKLSFLFIFKVYKFIIRTLSELLDLLNHKTYNKLKRRYDTIVLSADQIILAVLFFSIFVLIFINILPYYLFYVLVWFIYQGIVSLEKVVVLLICDFREYYFLDLECPGLICSVDFKVKLRLLIQEIKFSEIF
ncbi:uncharacterized protein VNE69_01345 [Vairimorpha necatrix]|uniref:Membrane protein n=1 Tax=Vairimorpha necatrix TaxID=6039 RepID=A0AAX4J915_9MICR